MACACVASCIAHRGSGRGRASSETLTLTGALSGARENGDDGRGSSCKGHSCCKGPARLWLGGGRWRVVEGGEGDSGRWEMEMKMVGGDGDWKTEVDDGRLQVS